MARIFIALLLSITAVWTAAAWGEDPHLELFSNQEEMEPLEDEVATPMEPLVVPVKPTKPAVPPLFGAASGILQDWKHSEDLPSPTTPAPKRSIASKPEPTETTRMTEAAMAEEKAFHDRVTEASAVPGTYQHILDVISTGSVRTRPIKDQ
jgi:hypothetical protein